jgi:hypothetical protein
MLVEQVAQITGPVAGRGDRQEQESFSVEGPR